KVGRLDPGRLRGPLPAVPLLLLLPLGELLVELLSHLPGLVKRIVLQFNEVVGPRLEARGFQVTARPDADGPEDRGLGPLVFQEDGPAVADAAGKGGQGRQRHKGRVTADGLRAVADVACRVFGQQVHGEGLIGWYRVEPRAGSWRARGRGRCLAGRLLLP